MHNTPPLSSPSPDPATSSADDVLLRQLERVLARVPPIIRLPQPGARCPYTQLSRTGLTELVAPTSRNGGKPPVKAIYQRAHRHAQRGTWLIPAENLFRYLLGRTESSADEFSRAEEERHDAHGPQEKSAARKGNI